jgi:tRNA(His) 5'-end guanylyltransferase
VIGACNAGQSRQQASRALDGASTADKNELLFRHRINFNDLLAWQRRDVGLWWETYQRPV